MLVLNMQRVWIHEVDWLHRYWPAELDHTVLLLDKATISFAKALNDPKS